MKTKTTQKTECVLAMDPGKAHFAWSYIALDGRVIDTGMIKNVIDDMRYMQFILQVRRFFNEIRRLYKDERVEVKHLVLERLTPRPGMGMGATAEYVNVMIGIVYVVSMLYKVGRMHAVMPSTWKQWLSRLVYAQTKGFDASPQAFNFNQVVKNEKKSDNFAIKEHQFDSIGLGLWHVCSLNPSMSKQYHANCCRSLNLLWEEKSRGK